MTEKSTFLFVMWEGGGTGPPELGLARRLLDAGYHVHILGDPTIEDRARGIGAGFTAWDRAPHRTTFDAADDVVRDWEAKNPVAGLKALRDRLVVGPAEAFAEETRAAIDDVGPDAVLVDALLLGAMAGAEGAGLPIGVVVPNIWPLPTDGVPAFGPGFAPATNTLGRLPDRLVGGVGDRVFAKGLAAFNAVRSGQGLPPLTWLWDQVLGADRIIVLTSPSFDFAAAHTPDNARFVGPILDDPTWAETWDPPWDADDDRPLVLVGFSTTYQAQEEQMQRVIDALAERPLRAVVTLGQMIDRSVVSSPSSDIVVVESAPHGPILQHAAAVITHCGHGTTMKALSAGVPMVCMPMGRDQNDTAARVVHAGAGVRISPAAKASRIGKALDRVLADDQFRRNARRMAELIDDERNHLDPVAECAALLSRSSCDDADPVT